MPNQIIDDVKTGLKGIKGAGDALRGSVMEATDQALDPNHKDPAGSTHQEASELRNRAIAEKGKSDMQAVDDMVARREQQQQGHDGAEKGLRQSQPMQPVAHHDHHPRPMQ